MTLPFLKQYLRLMPAGILAVVFLATPVSAQTLNDQDSDGLNVQQETQYGTSPNKADTDGDGYQDGEEVYHGYNPLLPGSARLPKRIDINLTEQKLSYSYGEYGKQGSFLISSGRKGFRTPPGSYAIQKKLPRATYAGWDGNKRYYYPNTKWNMQFMPSYYIHGAYWHNNFGTPMSHGCINVSYADMQKLYEFADVGTEITIHY